ncbi:hypothetical protein LXL04_033944 [Taraxacum kok-saghyz]
MIDAKTMDVVAFFHRFLIIIRATRTQNVFDLKCYLDVDIDVLRCRTLAAFLPITNKEQTNNPQSSHMDLEELMKDVQEARRIKMMHQEVMDMEHKLQALRMNNGVDHPSESIHYSCVGSRVVEIVHLKHSFWQPKIGLSFVVGFESERERNAAIVLARRFAFGCNKF